jgi:diguanylate cyclase (GGDEF)-like protein
MSARDHRPKILIVDDNRENLELLLEVFRQGFRVSAAADAERALRLAQAADPPDIILLDILLPGMDGYELCGRLKDDADTRDIPVIFVTAVSEVMDAARGFAAGAVDYITKPIHPPVVRARVALHLELKRKYELLEAYAFIDALTEVSNRRRCDQALADEWNRARRARRPLSLIYWDVDHFKAFNDRYGHGQGDDCLRRLATTAAATLSRSGDFIGRYGGEEFLVLLPYTGHAQALAIARELSAALDDLAIVHAASPVAPHVTVSAGVVTVDPHLRLGLREITDAADRALYAAKHSGRHCIEGIELSAEGGGPRAEG